MISIALCITCYDEDYQLLPNLLGLIQDYQTDSPDEIIIISSGINNLDIPETIKINNKEISITVCMVSKRIIQSKARNIGASITKSDYIIFFDVDDYPQKQKIQITKKIIKDTECDFFLHNYYNSADDFSKIFSTENLDNIEIHKVKDINKSCTNISVDDYPIHQAHICVKRSIFSKLKFNESWEFYRTEDGKFCQDLVTNGYQGIYCPIKLVQYTSKNH
jgi:hypothetical protein